MAIPGRHRNTLDLCATGWFTIVYERVDAKAGYVGGMSATKIRAEEQLVRMTDDRCRMHGASVVVNPSGRWRMGYCSHPLADNAGTGGPSRRYHEALASVVENEGAGIKQGYVGFLGAYEAPKWYEFVMRSALRRCQGPFR